MILEEFFPKPRHMIKEQILEIIYLLIEELKVDIMIGLYLDLVWF